MATYLLELPFKTLVKTRFSVVMSKAAMTDSIIAEKRNKNNKGKEAATPVDDEFEGGVPVEEGEEEEKPEHDEEQAPQSTIPTKSCFVRMMRLTRIPFLS